MLTNMNSRDFCYWLQGYFEISHTDELTKEQFDMIKKHLGYVFTQEDLSPKTLPVPSGTPVKTGGLSDYFASKFETSVC